MADFGAGEGNRTLVFVPVSYTHLDVYKRQVLLESVDDRRCVFAF